MEKPDSAFDPAKRAAPETLQSQRKLAHRFFCEILNALPGLTAILNSYRQIVFANKAFTQFVGLSADALIGQKPGEVWSCVHSQEEFGGCGAAASCEKCGMALAFKKGASVQDCRVERRRTKVCTIDLRVCARPFQIEGRQFTVFSVEDITAQRRRYALERIFYHDLLNTATGMEGLATLLAEEQSANSEIQSVSKLISFSAGQLTDAVNAQRILSAAEGDALDPSSRRIELKPLLEQIVQFYAAHYMSHGRPIRVLPRGDLPSVETDPDLLRRVLLNLLKAAVEESEKGQTITVRVTSDRRSVRIQVHIPAVMNDAVKSQLFCRCISNGANRELVTYTALLLTERYLGGQISFASAAPKGTIFTLTLPLKWHKPLALANQTKRRSRYDERTST